MDRRQLNLFGEPEPAKQTRGRGVGPADPDPDHEALAARLPAGLRFGTSSWSFPGWAGLVYDREASKATLARKGLAAYSRHPLLRAVGLDRTYYAPIGADEFRAYAEAVPEDFRFLVKACGECTSPWARDEQGRPGGSNSRFLDEAWATEQVIEPYIEGLAGKAGTLLFQFPPVGPQWRRQPQRFADELGRFLSDLPRGPLYSVELRDRELFTEDYVTALRTWDVEHCFSVHPRMPSIAEQRRLVGDRIGPTLVARWMLHGGLGYEEARDRYAPFAGLVDEDPSTREALAKLCQEHLAEPGREAIIVANNKAEGSAPWTIFKLAAAIG